MAYPAAMLFLNTGDSYQTFKLLTNLIVSWPFIYSLYSFKIEKIRVFVNVFDFFLGLKHPAIVKHL